MSALDYKLFAEHGSMPNTPNTWGIFLIGLVCEWLESIGGIAAIDKLNQQKANLIYKVIDAYPEFYLGHSEASSRSRMNVTFTLPNSSLEEEFLKQAEAIGLYGLKGHRSVGGIRASLYNAFPLEGTEKLAEFMRAFRLKQI
jgi:phosphoserine aminotransferase